MATKTFKIGLSNQDKQNMAQDVYERLLALTFPEYDTTASYSVGDFVVYNDQLYKCIGSTSGTWDATKWQLATLNDLLTDIESAVAFVNDKANVDGNYPTMTVGLADNLTPYSEDSGAEQEQPFILQGTGCGNGTEIITTGDYALLREKQGHTLKVIQKINNPNFSSQTGWGKVGDDTTISVSDNVLTFTVNEQNKGIYYNPGTAIVLNHKYFMMTEIKLTTGTTNVDLRLSGTTIAHSANTTDWQVVGGVFNSDRNTTWYPGLNDNRSSDWDAIQTKRFVFLDITEWDADAIADLTAHPENFFRYYNGSLAYNTGSLENSNGRYLVATGRNIYNPSETYNVVIPNASFFASKTTTITYYYKDKNVISTENVSAGNTFTTPSNCVFISSSVSTITITPYYTDQEGGEGYLDNNNVPIEYPYEEPTIVDTGSEVLRSAGSVKDYKEPNGTIHRVVGTYTFTGNETWTSDGDDRWYCDAILSLKAGGLTNFITNIPLDKNEKPTVGQMLDMRISGYAYTGRIFIRDSNLTSASDVQAFTSGKTINYELSTEAEPEQGTTFPENIKINDYGMMYWLDSSNNLVSIPQGNKLFYPVNYKGFVDDVYSRTEGDASKLVIQDELSASETARDTVDTQLLNAIGGTLRQCLCVKANSLDFDNTNFVDLGSLSWEYASVQDNFTALLSDAKGDNNANLLCTKYKYGNPYGGENKTIMCYNQYVRIKDTTYGSDIDAFKAAMKGILLAYEKE